MDNCYLLLPTLYCCCLCCCCPCPCCCPCCPLVLQFCCCPCCCPCCTGCKWGHRGAVPKLAELLLPLRFLQYNSWWCSLLMTMPGWWGCMACPPSSGLLLMPGCGCWARLPSSGLLLMLMFVLVLDVAMIQQLPWVTIHLQMITDHLFTIDCSIMMDDQSLLTFEFWPWFEHT